MPGRKKRGFQEVVDLTGDDGPSQQAKRQSPSPAVYSNGVGRASIHNPSINGRSSLSSSQPLTSSQTAAYEHEVLDLTQDDDEPARELYGTFGE